MAALPPTPIRRIVSLVLVLVAAVVVTVLSPVVLPVLLVVDLVTGAATRRTRVWCMVLLVLFTELAGVAAAGALTVWHVGRLDRARGQDRFHRLEHWWAGRHARTFRRVAGVRWMVENPEAAERGDAIVLARHASHADAILPAILFGNMAGFHLRYTLKEELQWAPAMDIVGNRLPNVFVDRTPGPDSPVARELEALARGLDERQVAVIFPEGTFFTPERLDRAASRIAETRPELEASARTLRHLLPPRPAGTIALLRGAPEADLILLAHEGMESFGDLRSIARNLPLTHPVQVRMWRIARADVPVDEDAFVAWLLDRWIEVDGWIQRRVDERRERAAGTRTPPARTGGREILT